jgi:hypothetical protein
VKLCVCLIVSHDVLKAKNTNQTPENGSAPTMRTTLTLGLAKVLRYGLDMLMLNVYSIFFRGSDGGRRSRWNQLRTKACLYCSFTILAWEEASACDLAPRATSAERPGYKKQDQSIQLRPRLHEITLTRKIKLKNNTSES